MELVIGLGNPGEEYVGTRHNVGREVVRTLADDWKMEKKLFAEIAKHDDVVYVLPTTYMNESGRSVQLLVTRYALRVANFVIVHDDIDLPLGSVRISVGASAGGHNGVQSIIDNLGTKEFTRVRIGVAGIGRSRTDAAAYVLKRFSKTELPMIKKIKGRARAALSTIIEKGVERAMQEYN